ncbi:NAD(P)/FAD-dependent oxidoreductase [Pandoraea terrigena]|uniref:Anthranilate 1,2-dioxygenase system ferredoxin--NAD(+) reductase component n=1 Tax=Pandoraea terrigena TaxID=2508292 RepID=A0A5E4VF81_9BURK|nr:FAD-dependent oxidoreductase [Pandoraea terrigena]VVE10009.1 Anthranilate 1,2-dioxygenase system ferredoxin--NAD(+) reductase component [Pandoraea terrigena]
MDRPIVIIGGGVAGVSAAESLRDGKYAGRIMLLSNEAARPYDRPPLSKEVLRADELPANIWLRDEDFYRGRGIELMLGVQAVSIDAEGHSVALSDGRCLDYEKLLLATGSRARVFDALPPGAPHVHYLRTLEDARALRQEMTEFDGRRHLLVIGAGIIGLEVSAVARTFGLEVTVIEPGTRPLGRSASPILSAFLAKAHAGKGVDIRCGIGLSTVEPLGEGYRVTLSDGSTLDVALVLVGIGAVPNLELARDAGIETQPEGIVVDGLGHTSAPDVYAAGEVAFHFNQRFGGHRREETWQHAADHGVHVAQCMIGACEHAYTATMSYWTDQYDCSVQVFGNPHGTSEVIRGDCASGSFSIFHLDQSSICGVTTVNASREMRKSRPLVLRGAVIPGEVIADPAGDPWQYS